MGGDEGIEWTLDGGEEAWAKGRVKGIGRKHISRVNM